MKLLLPLICVSLSPVAGFAAEFQYPIAVAASGENVIYVADRKLPGIWKVTDGKADVYFQGEKKFRTPLNAVRCLAVDAKGVLYAGDSATREVYRFDEQGKPQPLTQGRIGIPMSIAIAEDGTLYVADLELHRIVKVKAGGGEPELVTKIRAPRGLQIDDQGELWVLTQGDDPLVKISIDGKSTSKVPLKERFQFANQLVVKEDIAYVSDGYAKTIWKIDAGGETSPLAKGDPLQNPVGLTMQGSTLLVTDPKAKSVFAIDAEGKVTTIAGP